LGLKERIRAIKTISNDKILVDAIGVASIDRETFIIQASGGLPHLGVGLPHLGVVFPTKQGIKG
jgi:hypothetical protein